MNHQRAEAVSLAGVFESTLEAQGAISSPGTVALVKRRVLRSLVLRCPCGCGDTLIINLDRRAGKAWRLYRLRGRLSLYPSVWRDTGCQSHFIIWRGRIFWCDYGDLEDDVQPELESRVLGRLNHDFQRYIEISDALDEVPWDVYMACLRLARKGLALRGTGDSRDEFAINPASHRN